AVAVAIDRHAVDVLHDEIGRAFRRGTAVQETRDVGMIEVGEDLAFAEQPLFRLGIDEPVANELDGDLLAEALVRPFRQVNDAHPAAPEDADDAIGPDSQAGRARFLHVRPRNLTGWAGVTRFDRKS